MGCMHSKKDLGEINPNIYRVVNVDDDGTELWNGQLEISRTELTLYRKGREPTRWPLKSLRRYGFDGELFSFEAGRSCPTGEGIYAFRCRRADNLFDALQNYIQGRNYSTDENIAPNDSFPIPATSNGPSVALRNFPLINSRSNTTNQTTGANTGTYVTNTSRSTGQSLSPNGTFNINSLSRNSDNFQTESNYLEPTPIRQQIPPRFSSTMRLTSIGSGPLSPDIASPESPSSITNILEVTTLNPIPSNGIHHGIGNVYQEFPLREANNKKLSLDIPPQDPAPGINTMTTTTIITSSSSSKEIHNKVHDSSDSPSSLKFIQNSPISPCSITNDSLEGERMYMNVTLGEVPLTGDANRNSNIVLNSGCSAFNTMALMDENPYTSTPTNASAAFVFNRLNSYPIDPNRCYENLEPGEIRPLLLRNRYSKPDIFAKVDFPIDKSEPCTPTAADRKVNYIVLDLDQPSIQTVVNSSSNNTSITPANSSSNTNSSNSTFGNISSTGNSLLPPESPKKAALGYATIDFDKTVALSNSTTPSSELDSDCSRKTRHNSTAAPSRHSNSISD